MYLGAGTEPGATSHDPARWGRMTIATTAVALALLALAFARIETLDWGAIGIMSALGLGTGLFAFHTSRRLHVSFSTAVYVASVALFGPYVALWVVAMTGIVLEAVVYRRRAAEAVRALSVRLIAVGAAGIVYGLIGGRIPPTGMTIQDVFTFTAMFGTYGVINSLVSAGAGSKTRWSPRHYVQWLAGRGIVVELAMLPLAMLMVACYTPGEPATFPLLAIVLIVSGAAARSLWDTRGQLIGEVAHLELLTSVGALAARSLPLIPLAEAVADLVRCRTGVRQVRIVVNSEAGGDCEVISRDAGEADVEASGAGQELIRRVLENHTIMMADVSLENADRYGRRDGHSSDSSEGDALKNVAWVVVPLPAKRHLLGAMALWFDGSDVGGRWPKEFLETLGSQVARALESAVLRDQVERKTAEVEEWNRILEQRVEERTARLSETERDLAALNADLERRVKERTNQLSEVQSRMVESGRLAAVGELAAGVAHELNNPLGGILGYVQYDIEHLERWRDRTLKLEEREQLVSHMKTIETATQRCRTIVSNLLTFAEAAGCSKEMMSANDAIKATIRMTADQLRMRGIELRVELDPRLPDVVGSPVQLQQVFMNIVVNARNAMESGGILTIRTGLEGEGPGERMVFASFADSGAGIAGANLERVWEPFFTTREVGQGTGLGLSVSYGIVREHGGEIEVESVVGQGTTFTVLIPAAPCVARAGDTHTRMETSVDRA